MVRRGMVLVVLSLTLLAHAGRADAQTQIPNPATDATYTAIPYSVPPDLHDRVATSLRGNPDINPPQAPAGWFAGVQANIVGPAIMQHVLGQVTRGTDTKDIAVPSATLNWVGSPQLEIGYRLPDALGELGVSYRSLATQGRSACPEFDTTGNATLRSRLDANISIAEYTSREFSLWPVCDMKAHVGVCLPSIYFDSHAFGTLHETRFSNYYFGAGPHLGFDFWRRTPVPGLELYARMNMALTVGWLQQRFEDYVTEPGLPAARAYSDLRIVREVPTGHIQVGVSYTPPLPNQQLRLLAGYTLERWWYLAQTEDSRGELTVQGLFLRAEWRY